MKLRGISRESESSGVIVYSSIFLRVPSLYSFLTSVPPPMNSPFTKTLGTWDAIKTWRHIPKTEIHQLTVLAPVISPRTSWISDPSSLLSNSIAVKFWDNFRNCWKSFQSNLLSGKSGEKSTHLLGHWTIGTIGFWEYHHFITCNGLSHKLCHRSTHIDGFFATENAHLLSKFHENRKISAHK